MASSSNSFSFHVPRTKYDMFISFRGEDTRTSFLSHLVKELRHNQIDFYIDDDKLHPGDEISSTLLQVIEEAYISLVIFSKHYASSTWCLEELVKIIECMERDQRIVIPVFYNVDPSDVRHQKQTFGEAFDTHKDKYEENMLKVQSWRSALKKVANFSGFHYPSKYQNEAGLIEEIVKDVLKKLSRIFSSESKGLVGIAENFECVESLLAIKSSEVRILGIWGMGGIGKTTIAEAVFDKYSSQYEGCCFLENIREESQKYGLHYLYEKLVSELLEGENPLLKGPAKARSTNVKRRLSRKKVFIVLDDVDTLEQLEKLTGEQICFGPSSRVIVTTRDKQILRRVHGIYEIRGLNYESSLQFFCLNAFGKVYPKIGYERLSKMHVDYANGIPLALKVLGSFLYSRSIEAWESALEKLKIYPNKDIFNVLKLSYDGLDDLERSIFLDIAFCFKGKDKDDVIRILDSYGFFASIGIDNLLCKALITISNSNIIQMHDLIEQMGWEIVRQESIKDPGKRSRLRNPEDVYNLLKNSRGTDLVEGIVLDLSQTRDLQLKTDTFKKMPYLRFLKLYTPCPWSRRSSNMYVPITFELFSNELRYLEWSEYPLKSLPSTFCAEKLVEFHMPNSQVSKLWDGVQDLVNLKRVCLHHCKQLVELPDFTKASNLKMIDLSFCERLCHLHPSILSIHTLEYLLLIRCYELKSLKSEIYLNSLKELKVKFCSSLEEFSILSESEELTELDLKGTRIDTLHSSIGSLSKLTSLNLHYVVGLKSLPDELCFLTSLEKLRLSDCEELIELPHNIKALSQLKRLYLFNCRRLQSLPELPASIQKLCAANCTSLETIFSLKAVFSLNRMSISFENCMRLDEHSLNDIMEDAPLAMVRAAFRNVLASIAHLSNMRRDSEFTNGEDRSYHKFTGWARYPGSKVPEWLRYRTRQASITVELDQPYHQLLGFFVCCVTSRLPSYGWPLTFHSLNCQYHFRDGERGAYSIGCIGIEADHVHISYQPSDCGTMLDHIRRCRTNDHCTPYNQNISFGFTVELSRKRKEEDFGSVETSEHDSLVKGCGIFPLYASDVMNFIQKMELELDLDDKSKIYGDLDELVLDELKSELILMMKEEPVPQSKIFDLAPSSNCNNLEEE